MSDNISVLLIGTGYMGKEYCKVLKALDVDVIAVCRSKESADAFTAETDVRTLSGGVDKALSQIGEMPRYAIVAVSVDQLANVTKSVIDAGIENIFVEKPAGLNPKEIEEVNQVAKDENAKVYVAYNRRFYASTERALEIIERDGGVSSVNFEFTEWGYTIEKSDHPAVVKEEWMLANSSHVIDLAFFFAGEPKEMKSYCAGSLPWHSRASKYAGAGITDNGVLFSYQANWDAPGRWAVEVLTKEHRLYFKPLEKLAIQKKGSVEVQKVTFDDTLDIEYKPGLYKQVKAFLFDGNDKRLLSIQKHTECLAVYKKIECI